MIPILFSWFVIAVIIAFGVTQIIVPLGEGTRLFPHIRGAARKLRGAKADLSEAELELATEKTKQAAAKVRSKKDSLTEDGNGSVENK